MWSGSAPSTAASASPMSRAQDRSGRDLGSSACSQKDTPASSSPVACPAPVGRAGLPASEVTGLRPARCGPPAASSRRRTAPSLARRRPTLGRRRPGCHAVLSTRKGFLGERMARGLQLGSQRPVLPACSGSGRAGSYPEATGRWSGGEDHREAFCQKLGIFLMGFAEFQPGESVGRLDTCEGVIIF
jgi:hypothetical protein